MLQSSCDTLLASYKGLASGRKAKWMTLILATLRKIPYLILTILLTLVFIALYMFFDLRQGGTHLTIFSAHLEPLQFFLKNFGAVYVWTRIALDVLNAFLSAVLIAVTIDHYRAGSAMFTGSACSTGATVILGLATFGCPSCVLPIAGTIGAVFTAKALPFLGIEFKILSLLIVIGTLFWLVRRFKQRSVPTQFVAATNAH